MINSVKTQSRILVIKFFIFILSIYILHTHKVTTSANFNFITFSVSFRNAFACDEAIQIFSKCEKIRRISIYLLIMRLHDKLASQFKWRTCGWSIDLSCFYLTYSLSLSELFFNCFSSVSNISIMLFNPVKYPSSWFPTSQCFLWVISTPSGVGPVLAKSISQQLACRRSWRNSRELPMISCALKNAECSRVARIAFKRWIYFVYVWELDLLLSNSKFYLRRKQKTYQSMRISMTKLFKHFHNFIAFF